MDDKIIFEVHDEWCQKFGHCPVGCHAPDCVEACKNGNCRCPGCEEHLEQEAEQRAQEDAEMAARDEEARREYERWIVEIAQQAIEDARRWHEATR